MTKSAIVICTTHLQINNSGCCDEHTARLSNADRVQHRAEAIVSYSAHGISAPLHGGGKNTVRATKCTTTTTTTTTTTQRACHHRRWPQTKNETSVQPSWADGAGADQIAISRSTARERLVYRTRKISARARTRGDALEQGGSRVLFHTGGGIIGGTVWITAAMID